MCGVIGVIGKEDVSSDIYNGLFSIQHRGQDSAGAYTYSREKGTYLHKEPGLVGDAFKEGDLKKLKGKMGIGHVRYPTIGSNTERDAQPFITSEPTDIGMVHNGNIVNYGQLKKELDLDLESRCDLELILEVFSRELEKEKKIDKESIFRSIGRTMDKLNGSYSVIALIPKVGLVIFRDPKGIKPLVIGKKRTLKEESYGVASENVALDILGYNNVTDVTPGKAIIIDKQKNKTSKQIRTEERNNCMFEWVYFARADASIENKDVYKTRLNLGRELARKWKEKEGELDVIFPVPETARTFALGMAEELDKPYREGLIKNRYVGRTFIMPDQTSRKTSIKMKLNPIIREIKDKKVGLVDDSIVRGNTSKKIIQLMKDAGAEEVHFFVGCPPIRYPCFYGIDMPTENELIASGRKTEEIKEKIGADSLTYQSIEGLVKGLELKKENLCLGCLNNNYPTKVGKKLKNHFSKQRKEERN